MPQGLNCISDINFSPFIIKTSFSENKVLDGAFFQVMVEIPSWEG
jgi:hypothetical protein